MEYQPLEMQEDITMHNQGKSLDDRVREWLQNQGYPLEMLVADHFMKAGFDIASSDYYTDCDSGEPREIDVRAYRWSDFDQQTTVQVCWNIECKLARSKPWVLFFSGDQQWSLFTLKALASPSVQVAFLNAEKDAAWRTKLHKLPLMNRRAGHSIAEAFSDSGFDMPYKAVMSAAKASYARLEFFNEVDKTLGEKVARNERTKQLCCISFPVVVFEQRLFEARLDHDGALIVTEVQESVLLWKGIGRPNSTTLVFVVTKQALGGFVNRAKELTDALIDLSEKWL